MSLPARTREWALVLASTPERTAAALAGALDLDPAALVDLGYQVETADLPDGFERLVFVPGRTPGEIAYLELTVDAGLDEVAAIFGPGQELPALPDSGAGRVAFDGIPGLSVLAGTESGRVNTLTFVFA
jgi:hypothetical protein